jgi:hypothetical protein
MRAGERVNAEPLEQIRERAAGQLTALPPGLRAVEPDLATEPYPVSYSAKLLAPNG